jgi:hypothetical protein
VRYLIPILPFLCLTAAVAVVRAGRFLANAVSPTPIWVSAIAFGIAAPSIWTSVAFDRIIQRTDTRVLAVAWLDAHRQPTDWIAETSPIDLYREYPAFGPPSPFRLAHFDAARRAFVSKSGEVVTPEWVIAATSPLVVYTDTSRELSEALAIGYTAAAAFVPTTRSEPAEIFDQQDKFFLPFADFRARVCPGPEIQIYRRARQAVSSDVP